MAKRLSKREQRILVICIIMALIYGGYNGVWIPFREQVTLLDQKLTSHRQKLIKELGMIRESRSLKATYTFYVNQFRQEKSNEQVMSSLLAEIESVADNLDLRIANLKPERVKSDGVYNRFSVSLAMESKFVDVLHFLHLLQSEPHLFGVGAVDFDKGSQRNTDIVKARISLEKVFIP